ncbi:MAG: protein kinase [Proteobacteria bacterium]|nr:protein kinase [Pseudomonadota bacterium]
MIERLGRGAMGEVWRGALGGHPVAVKRLHPELSRRPERREAFLHEVRAVARLHHPALIAVYDYGIDEGVPWMAMELASQGTLAAHPPESFAELRERLLVTLDALAHAHAHDLTHRDLKPSNLLICGHTDARPGLKLADFGIAQALGAEDALAHSGTPLYMAPEQVLGAWRQVGPWTDLYALGCLGFQFATGSAPFRGTSGELRRAHLSAPVPRLRPHFPVPAGYEPWLRRLLMKAPAERYRCAADAAWALRRLEHAEAGHAQPSWPLDAPTLTHFDGSAVLDGTTLVGTPDAETEAMAIERAPWPLQAPPTLPVTAHRGLGLGVASLREVPLVGRQRETSKLWERLSEALEAEDTRVVVLHGPPDIGKTRLAQWLVRQVRACGGVGLFVDASGVDPVAEALRTALHSDGLSDDALSAHLKERTGSAGLATTLTQDTRKVGEMWSALRAWAEERPLVIALDPISPDAIELARAATGHGAILLLTARDNDLDAARREALAHASFIPVGPLDERDWTALADAQIGVSHALSGRLAVLSEGIPGVAERWVSSWVENQRLRSGDGGLELDETALRAAAEPSNYWLHRVRAALQDPTDQQEALEIAAALGVRVDRERWHALIGGTPEGLEGGLASRGLIRPTGTGFAFVHPGITDALRHLAGERWATHQASCAATATDDESKGRHWLAAQQPRQAIAPLLRAAHQRHLRGQFRRARDLYQERTDAMQSVGIDEDDPRWADGWNKEAITWRMLGDFDRCVELGGAVEALGRRIGEPSLIGDGLITQGVAFGNSGKLAEGLTCLDAAIGHLEGRPGRQRAHVVRAGIRILARQLDGAEADLQTALSGELAPYLRAEALRHLGGIGFLRGNPADFEARLTEAIAIYEATGDRWGQAVSVGDLGVVAHVRGDLDKAEQFYRRAMELWQEVGGRDQLIAQNNLAMVQAATGRFAEALQGSAWVEAQANKVQLTRIVAPSHAVQLVASAGLGDGASFDATLERTRALTSPSVDEDLPQLAKDAADHWDKHGDQARTQAALAQAAHWAAALG